jgi:uncharacterized membrane protein (DUF106 family)
MMPEWIVKLLMGMGVPGGIIFVLLLAVSGLVAYVRTLQAKADKVYGFRLQERDVLNKTLSDTAGVLKDLLEVTEERNDLTEDQAKLIEKQSAAFELLKATILAQYENIKDNKSASLQAVTSMAEAIRALTSIVVENRVIAQGHVQNVQHTMDGMKNDMIKALRESSDAQIKELRSLLGNVTRIEHRRKKTP